MNKTITLWSIGGGAEQLGCSRQLLRNLEIAGIVPPPHRLAGSDRRCYDAQQMHTLERVLAERRARQQARRRQSVVA